MARFVPLIEQLEIRRRQSAHRIAGAVDDRDRHLDEVNVDRLFDLCGCSARCEQKKERNAAEATHRNDFLPVPNGQNARTGRAIPLRLGGGFSATGSAVALDVPFFSIPCRRIREISPTTSSVSLPKWSLTPKRISIEK